ncbi:stabilizer of axonemal microtubules 1-like [Macaca mulatta]
MAVPRRSRDEDAATSPLIPFHEYSLRTRRLPGGKTRHHCRHGITRIYENSGVFCPTTEYLEKYPMYDNVLPAQSLKPKQEIQACCGKMEGITTFK